MYQQIQLSKYYIQDQLRKADERRIAQEVKEGQREQWFSKRRRKS